MFSVPIATLLHVLLHALSLGAGAPLAAATAPAAAAPHADSSLAIVDVNVVPMDAERTLAHQTVVIRGDRIVAIGAVDATPVPAGATRVDGRGLWLMTGLIDMHVHLNDPDDGPLYVANGVTTIRSMWGFPETLEWRREYLAGRRLGPTVFTTGPILDGRPPIWPDSTVIETAEQAEREVVAEQAAGFDFVKVYSRLTRPAYDAILAATKRHHMRVVGHVPDSVGVPAALEARGQESIEHLTGYLTAAQSAGSDASRIADWNARRKAMLAHVDGAKLPDLARRSREAGVWNCVTLVVQRNVGELEHRDSLMQLPVTRYVSPEVLGYWDPAKDFRFQRSTADDFAAMRAQSAFQIRMTRALRDSGARLLLGTDTSNPFVVAGFAVHDELALLVEAGLTPYEALRAGTAAAAEFLHADCGQVRVGARADLVLVDADPLADPRAAARRRGVVLRGRWLPAAELDRALEDVARLRHAAPAPPDSTARH